MLIRQKEILRSSRHKNLQNQINEDFFNTICTKRCNADNKTQSFNMWPEPFIKSFTSSSGSFLQINYKSENKQVKIYFIIDMKVSKSLHFY